MSSGSAKVQRGSFIGTGAAAIDIKILSFRPRSVKLFNVGGLIHAKWVETMADASMVKRITNGNMSFEESNGITPLADGFTVGGDSSLNGSGEVVHWEAIE